MRTDGGRIQRRLHVPLDEMQVNMSKFLVTEQLHCLLKIEGKQLPENEHDAAGGQEESRHQVCPDAR